MKKIRLREAYSLQGATEKIFLNKQSLEFKTSLEAYEFFREQENQLNESISDLHEIYITYWNTWRTNWFLFSDEHSNRENWRTNRDCARELRFIEAMFDKVFDHYPGVIHVYIAKAKIERSLSEVCELLCRFFEKKGMDLEVSLIRGIKPEGV